MIIINDPRRKIFLQFVELSKESDYQKYKNSLSDPSSKLGASPTYEDIEELKGLYRWNTNLRNSAIAFKDPVTHMRLACYRTDKGFSIGSENDWQIHDHVCFKAARPNMFVKTYYGAYIPSVPESKPPHE